ncbi:hypothetical protein EON77_10675 [bacterium]|nr:MAG: hypothetical protein EON77_10675 [bacterium]
MSKLTELALRLAPRRGMNATPVPELRVARADRRTAPEFHVGEPVALGAVACTPDGDEARETEVESAEGAASLGEAAKAAALALEWKGAWKLYELFSRMPAPSPIRSQIKVALPIDIDAPVDHVFAAYSDFDNHLGRHAFLKDIVVHSEKVEDGVVLRSFTAIEDVPFAGVPVRLHTHAQQRVYAKERRYETDSYDAPDVLTHQNVTFEDLGGGRTRVTESLVFETNPAIVDFTARNGTDAHVQNQNALKADLESGAL